ncbi:MAG: PKD repeat protein [Sphingobacteriales bacterium]|jgi:PKD repeat protein
MLNILKTLPLRLITMKYSKTLGLSYLNFFLMKLFFSIMATMLAWGAINAQTVPSAHVLSEGKIEFNFLDFGENQSNYFPHMQGWSSDSNLFAADGQNLSGDLAINGDWPLDVAPASTANHIQNAYDAADHRGIRIQSSQNRSLTALPAGIMFHLNTENIDSALIFYDLVGFVGQVPGSLHLLYRIGSTGDFIEIPEGRYRAATAGVSTRGSFSFGLPPATMGHPSVHFFMAVTKEAANFPNEAPLNSIGVTFEIDKVEFLPVNPTNPVPHVLGNGPLFFDGFEDPSQTVYPNFMQGWVGESIEAATGDDYPTNLIPILDSDLMPNGTDNAVSGVHNEGDNGVSIKADRDISTNQSLAIAINTVGVTGIDFSWKAISTFSTVDGNSVVQLQYRVGSEGDWTNLDGHDYLNSSGSATAGTMQNFGPTRLPTELENQEEVQFRWFAYLNGATFNGSNRTSIDSVLIATETAEGQPPIAAFTISNDEPDAGQIVTFTNQSAGEPDSYLWNFGDGIDSTSTETSPFHTYSEGGEYIVSLIATNGFGSDTAYDTVLVYQNFAPTAEDDVSSTPKNTPDTIQVASNDFDEENNINLSSVAVVSEPSSGAVEPQGDGSLIYMPNTDFVGDDEFTYEICDLDGLCDTAQVTIRVFETGGGNFAPRAKNDVATTDQDLAVNVKVLANDIDVDGQLDVQTLAVTIDATNGTTTVNVSESTITFTPNQGYSGVDSFQYTICDDADETLCDSAWVTVTVNKVATSVNSNANAVKVYPNPASDMINIELTGSGTSTVRIFNVLGKTVYSTQTSLKSFAIDVNDFTSGVYFLQVENNLGLNQKTVVIK